MRATSNDDDRGLYNLSLSLPDRDPARSPPQTTRVATMEWSRAHGEGSKYNPMVRLRINEIIGRRQTAAHYANW